MRVGPFTVEGDHMIAEAQWFGDVRVLALKTEGCCAIFNCTEPPLRVTVNDQPHSNWTYFGVRGCLEICGLPAESAVKVFWPIHVSGLPAAAIRVEAVSLGVVEAGAEKIFQIPVEFSGSSILIIRVEFKSCADWFRVEERLPRAFTSSPESSVGRAYISVKLRVPANATADDIAVPVVVYAAGPSEPS
ncbi:MAG: hypothetical protein QW294_04735 [Candidatus Bathyarchaeia archaeon]